MPETQSENRERSNRYYAENRDRVRARSKARYYEAAFASVVSSLCTASRNRSRAKGVFDAATHVSREFVLRRLVEDPKCDCCRQEFDFTRGRGHKGNDRSPTLDQIKPGEGYHANNVGLLCYRCNRIKADATSAELFSVARWMKARGL